MIYLLNISCATLTFKISPGLSITCVMAVGPVHQNLLGSLLNMLILGLLHLRRLESLKVETWQSIDDSETH